MNVAELFLHDIDKVAKKLSDRFGSLSYDTFMEDTSTIESAILGFLIMKEGWRSLSATIEKMNDSSYDALVAAMSPVPLGN